MRPSVPASGDGHTFESNQSDDEKMAIVPGFDGSLYWISDEEPATNSGESEGSAAYLLPLNALEVADAPRTLCDEEGEDDGAGSGGGSGGGGRCGLIVGERSSPSTLRRGTCAGYARRTLAPPTFGALATTRAPAPRGSPCCCSATSTQCGTRRWRTDESTGT